MSLAALLLPGLLLGTAPLLQTEAEATGYERSGRYEEVVRLCAAFERAHPRAARCIEYGRSPEGRPLLAIAASADGLLAPAANRSRARPVILVHGAIHGSELDGKDGAIAALRELLALGRKGPLAHVTLLVVPVANPDGHERFGTGQRPNQNGPAEVGWRTNALNLNLDRDYTKLEAPELRALLRLAGTWDPVLVADIHVSDGAPLEHDLSAEFDAAALGAAPLRATAAAVRDEFIAKLEAYGHAPLAFYPKLLRAEDPTSGFAVTGTRGARYGTVYWRLRNRLAVLVELRCWKPYRQRVAATRRGIVALAELGARDGARWSAAARAADEESRALAGEEVPVRWTHGERVTPIRVRGYAWRKVRSELSGRDTIRYDETRPEPWEVPLRDEVQPAQAVRLPRGGYLVPPAHAAWMAEKLALHGIEFEVLASARRGIPAESFRFAKAKPAKAPLEGRQTVRVEGRWRREKRDLAAGSLYVPAAQPRARLLAQLLEPEAPDSFAAWGFFNAVLEKKQRIEPHVLEDVAARVIARDPAARAELERKLAADPELASDPDRRLELLWRRDPSWDASWRVYPVLRLDRALREGRGRASP